MDKIDQALDSMNPAELAALEVEVDKQAADAKVAFHFATGVKLAQEAVELYKETGELSPVFSLLTPAKVAAEAGSLDAELDKCSAEQLAAIEAELDKGAELAAEKKASDEYAAKYFEMGVKMAQDQVAKLAGNDATKIASCSKSILDKIAAGQFLGGMGFSKAREMVTRTRAASGGSAANASKSIRSAGAVFGAARLAKNHPVATGALLGAGGLMAAQSVFGDKK
jgi:hypothetical protein